MPSRSVCSMCMEIHVQVHKRTMDMTVALFSCVHCLSIRHSVCVCVCACVCVCVRVRVCACVHACARVCVCEYMCGIHTCCVCEFCPDVL